MNPSLEHCATPDALEAVLAEALRGRRLVFEIGIDAVLRERIVSVFSTTVLPQCARSYSAVARRYPAVLATAVASDGVFTYRAGDLWGQVTLPAASRAEIGQAFTHAIRRLNLEPLDLFDEQGATRYVSRILAHGGVPVYCLGDLFRLVIHARARGLDDAHDVVELLREGAAIGQQVDRPAQRFLRDTGAVGRDFLQRVLELPDVACSAVASTILADRIGLPGYVVTEFRKLDPVAATARASVPRVARPRLVFDVDAADGPELVLPGASIVAAWRVVHEASVALAVTEAPPQFAEDARIAIAPASRWHVTATDDDGHVIRDSAILGVSEARPILAFNMETSEQLADPRFSPTSRVCVLAPCELEVLDGAVKVDRNRAIASGPWSGWSTSELMVEGPGTLSGQYQLQRIEVRLGREEAVRIGFSNIVRGATAEYGREVFDGAPHLVTVPWSTESADRWQVTLSSPSIGSHTFAPRHDLDSTNKEIARFVGGRLLPDLTLRLLGPMGGGYRLTAAVVPGLYVELPGAPLFPGEIADVNVSVALGLTILGDEHSGTGTALQVRAEMPRVAIAVTSDSGVSVEVNIRCPAIRWRLMSGDSSIAPFGNQVIRRSYHLDEHPRMMLVADLGGADMRPRLLVDGLAGVHGCEPVGQPIGGIFRFDLSHYVRDAIAQEALYLRFILESLGRQCVLAELEEAVSASLVSIQYVVAAEGPVLHYEIEQSRPVPGRAIEVECTDRPWLRPFTLALSSREDEGIIACSRLRPGRYGARVVLGNGDGTARTLEGSQRIEFAIPWSAGAAANAPIEDERELLVEAVVSPGTSAPTLRDPVGAAPAAVLLLGGSGCNSTSARLLLDAVPLTVAEWVAAFDKAGEEFGLTNSIMVRSSVRVLGRAPRAGRRTDGSGMTSSRVLRLAVIADGKVADRSAIESLTGLREEEWLSIADVLGSNARPVNPTALSRELRALRRLPTTPLSINGRARGIIDVRSWGLSRDPQKMRWLDQLARGYALSLTHLSTLPRSVAQECHQALDWLKRGECCDGPLVAVLHAASFAAAAQLIFAPDHQARAADYLASVAKTFPEYVETRVAYFLARAALAPDHPC